MNQFTPEIQTVKTSSLVPYVNNSRTHSDEQVSQIAASIKEFGFTNPILTDGENGIIAGHGRLLAAKKLGLDEVPTIELAHLSEPQRRALVIADNKLAMNAGWDEEMLKIEVEHLNADGFNTDLLGWDSDQLEDLLNFGFEPEVHDDSEDIPEVEEVNVTQTGQLWVLGEHRLLCGDCTKADDVERVLAGDTVDQLLTDPPYGVDYSAKAAVVNSGKKLHKDIANDSVSDLHSFFLSFLSSIKWSTKNTAFIFMSSNELHNLRVACEDAGLYWSEYLIWVKNNFVLNRKDYNLQHELIYYGWHGTHEFFGPTNSSTVIEHPKPHRSELHPTMKPIPLVARLMTDGSKIDDIVYEPFCGSGTTLIAAEQLKRKCRAIEMEECYCDVIVRRWKQETGQEVYDEDGKSFSEYEAELA